MHFPNGYISVFLCTLLLFAGAAESGENSDFTSRITKQRTVSCPLKLDTTGIESEKDRRTYYWKQALAEFPYQHMNNVIKFHTDIVANQVLTSTGGHFVVNEDRNSISQLYCTYSDANNSSVRLAFSFRQELKLHVTDRFPAVPDEIIFPKAGAMECSAVNELSTPEKPHCRGTLASLLITNQVEVITVDGYPKNPDLFGYLKYKSSTAIPEYTGEPDVFDEEKKKALIKPGETRFYPVPLASNDHGVLVGVRVFEDLRDVTELCINSWLPKAQLLVKYGVSPHILISGQVGTDGNPKSDFECELRCNEKAGQNDCWDVWFYEKLGSYFSRGERAGLNREYMLATANEAYGVDFSEESDEVLLRKCQAIPYYKALGLKAGAPVADFKKAYRELSKQLHPDKFKHHEEQLYIVQNAYKRLKMLNDILIEDEDEEESVSGSNGRNGKKPTILHDEL